jgi:hypothetical protein
MKQYGDKRDYPKIYIFVNGNYKATTTWSKTCKEAVARWHMQYGHVSNEKITANFAKD